MPYKTNGGRSEATLPALMAPFGFDALMELNRPALAAMAQMNGKVYENIAAMNRNWADFLNRRLKEELAVPQQLAACKSVQDVYGVCADFIQTAVADYQTELEAMGKLGKTLADDTVHAMQARLDQPAHEKRTSD